MTPSGVVVLAAAVILSLPVTWRRCSVLGVVAGATLAALCLLPARLAAVRPENGHAIAHHSPDLTTYGLATVGLGVLALRRGGVRAVPRSHVALAVLLLVGSAVVWTRDLQTAAGVQQYLLAPPALAGGAVLGAALVTARASGDPRLPRTLALSCTLVLAAQLAVAAAQRAGVPVVELNPATAALMGDRVNGTLAHPNVLGKVVLLLLVLAVPLTRYPDLVTRRLAAGAVVLGLPLLGLTGGRVNLLATVGFLVLWALTLPGGQRSRRYRTWLVVGTVVLTAPFAAAILGRFREDPFGGSRGALTRQALEALPAHWLVGVGPNRYVTDIGYLDPVTGRGLPVHNVFLLVLLELGVVGAVLLLSVWVLAVLRRVRVPQDGEVGDAFARALVMSSPAVLLVAMTGWGLVGRSILPLWFLVIGICVGAAPRTAALGARRRPAEQRPTARGTLLQRQPNPLPQ